MNERGNLQLSAPNNNNLAQNEGFFFILCVIPFLIPIVQKLIYLMKVVAAMKLKM